MTLSRHAFRMIGASIKDFKKLYEDQGLPEPIFIWKTSHPGHLLKSDGSLATRHNLRQRRRSLEYTVDYDGLYENYSYLLANPQNDPYHYYLFPSFDEISKFYAKELGFHIIDMFPLYYRADSLPYHVHDTLRNKRIILTFIQCTQKLTTAWTQSNCNDLLAVL